MEIVKGRAVSRTNTGYADVGVIVEAIADLADHVDAAAALALKKYVKHLPDADTGAFVSPVSIARYAAIRADSAIPAADLNPADAQCGVQRHGPDRAPAARVRLRAGAQLRADQQVRVHERREPDALVPGRRRVLPLPGGRGPARGLRRRLLHRRLAVPAGRDHRAGGGAADRARAVRPGLVREPWPSAELHLLVGVPEHLRVLPARARTRSPAARRSARTAWPAWSSPTTPLTPPSRRASCPTTSSPTGTPARPSRGSCSTTRSWCWPRASPARAAATR